MNIPYVIWHMSSTIDGRIKTANWWRKEEVKQFSRLYEKCHETYQSRAWMAGRVTSEKDFSKGEKVAEGYRAMDERRAMKTLLIP